MNSNRTASFTGIVAAYGFWIVLAIALAVRLGALANHQVIVTDGIRFSEWAHNIVDGNWIKTFPAVDFNLYPVMHAAVYKGVTVIRPVSYEAAGLLLNLICGLLLLYPLYALTRRYLGPLAAFAAGVYLAVLPPLVDVTCMLVREPLFLCLAMWGIYLFLDTIQATPAAWRRWRLMLAGALVFLATMVRPEAFGLLACMGLTLFVAHMRRDASYAFDKRFRAAVALIVAVPFLAAIILLGLHAKTGIWHFGRIANINKPTNLGIRTTTSADPLDVTKAEIFGPDGKLIQDAVIRVNFTKLAKRHREVLFAWELIDAVWKSFLGIGAVLSIVGIWLVARRRMLAPTDPLVVLLGSSTVLIGALFYVYISHNYYLATRHALSLTLPLSVLVAAPFALMWPASARLRLLAWAGIAAGLVYFTAESVRAKNRQYLPLRTYGEALAPVLAPDAIIVASPTLTYAAFYAGRPMATLAVGQTNLPPALTNRASRLLLNLREPWQATYFAHVSNSLERVDIALPGNGKKYDLNLYRPVAPAP